jgi:hypothetical protein
MDKPGTERTITANRACALDPPAKHCDLLAGQAANTASGYHQGGRGVRDGRKQVISRCRRGNLVWIEWV